MEKILVVDDEKLVLDLMTEMLGVKGYNVRSARLGQEALKIAIGWEPDLVLLDVTLPDMHGFDVCRRLRMHEATANVPVIFVSGKTTLDDKAKGFEVGGNDYITKPFDNEELVMRVTAQLRRASRAAADEEEQVARGKIIAVFSLRGGAGCTTIAVNLAACLAQIWQYQVPLLDFSLPIGSCDVMLDAKPRLNLADIAQSDQDEIDDAVLEATLHEHISGVRLLGGNIDPVAEEYVTDEVVERLCEFASRKFPYVVIDLPHKLSLLTITALTWADEIIMPVTPDISSVRVALTTIKNLEAYGISRNKLKIIVNWTFAYNGLSEKRLETLLKHPVSMVIRHDNLFPQAVNFGNPVTLAGYNSPTVDLLEILAWRASLDEDRISRPEAPSAMWNRVLKRIQS